MASGYSDTSHGPRVPWWQDASRDTFRPSCCCCCVSMTTNDACCYVCHPAKCPVAW